MRSTQEKMEGESSEVAAGNEASRARIAESFDRIGARMEEIHPEIIERLVMLEERSKFNADSRMIQRGMRKVLEKLTESSAAKFTDEELRDAERAAIVHDIGKSGPAEASEEAQRAVVDLFAAPHVESPNQSVENVVHKNFPDTAEEMLALLSGECGVGIESSMRKFWDWHAHWTKDILEKHPEGFDEKVRILAGSHHIDRGVNPYNIKDTEDMDPARAIGALEYYLEALQHRALMVIDKYQASVSRSGRTHEEALSTVRAILGNKYDNDEAMQKILEVVDELGQKGGLLDEEHELSKTA